MGSTITPRPSLRAWYLGWRTGPKQQRSAIDLLIEYKLETPDPDAGWSFAHANARAVELPEDTRPTLRLTLELEEWK